MGIYYNNIFRDQEEDEAQETFKANIKNPNDDLKLSAPPDKIPNIIDSVTDNIKYNFLNVNKVNKFLCQCFNRYTYLWLNDGRSFWIWLISIHDTYIICYRWNGARWVSAQIAKNKIRQIG
ncbi:hypothetical protein SAMN02745248_02181 [Hathewaya proteolytica DSM 3090]|uniref:Uncharacterized protein n=1 Tax=Hathewaya proteolytica DSM 3090 TaxID=1121331 RepID=A0A1M6R2J7_9CLOT|nr:hypothetical protein [Hathewaya proteolytica]SHK26699.1 hypothetical protein SAMN02745248_02181 [Hathewaya proteolytica DSM 3090]